MFPSKLFHIKKLILTHFFSPMDFYNPKVIEPVEIPIKSSASDSRKNTAGQFASRIVYGHSAFPQPSYTDNNWRHAKQPAQVKLLFSRSPNDSHEASFL